jgi:hypothetical protein
MKVVVNAEELNRMIVMMGRVVIVFVLTLVTLSLLHAQSLTPAAPGTPLKAIYTPPPAY